MKGLATGIKRKLGLLATYTLNGVTLDLTGLSKKLVYSITEGRYEDEERKLCARYLEKSDRVIEFGSSIGFLSLYCRKVLGIQEVLCVEPNPDALKEMEKNYLLNGETVNILSVCLSARDEEITFHANRDLWESSFIEQPGANTRTITVRGARFTSILNETSFVPTAMIMDIEGGESVVNFDDLPDSVSKVVIELHPALVGTATSYRVLNELMNRGFEVRQKLGNCYALLRKQ